MNLTAFGVHNLHRRYMILFHMIKIQTLHTESWISYNISRCITEIIYEHFTPSPKLN